jgi:hypothetical protein
MATIPDTIEALDARIAAVRDNLRQLVEQAAGYSGAADEELISQRIAEQEIQLETLIRSRGYLA